MYIYIYTYVSLSLSIYIYIYTYNCTSEDPHRGDDHRGGRRARRDGLQRAGLGVVYNYIHTRVYVVDVS